MKPGRPKKENLPTIFDVGLMNGTAESCKSYTKPIIVCEKGSYECVNVGLCKEPFHGEADTRLKALSLMMATAR